MGMSRYAAKLRVNARKKTRIRMLRFMLGLSNIDFDTFRISQNIQTSTGFFARRTRISIEKFSYSAAPAFIELQEK